MLVTQGHTLRDMAGLLPPGSFQYSAPLERTGLSYGRVSTPGGPTPLEASMTPLEDILTVHLSELDVRARSGGNILFEGHVHAGASVICMGGVPTEVTVTGAVEVIKVFLPRLAIANAAAELVGVPTTPYWEGLRDDPELVRRVTRAAAAAITDDPANRLAADIMSLSVLEALLTAGSGARLNPPGQRRRGGFAGWQVRRVLDYLEAHLGEEVTIAALAAEVGLSPFHFIRAFRQSTALTPHAWLFRRRVGRMKSLLTKSDAPMSEISAAVGYGSVSAMSSAFRRGTGYSPRQWRRMTGR